jgi:hypothetical protein
MNTWSERSLRESRRDGGGLFHNSKTILELSVRTATMPSND